MSTKTPLHSVVAVICDSLVELSADDQLRVLEATRVSLGLRAPRVVPDRNPYRDALDREPLPIVEVQMMGDRAVVVNQSPQQAADRPQGRVMAGPQRTTVLQPRQLPAPASGGYVRPRR